MLEERLALGKSVSTRLAAGGEIHVPSNAIHRVRHAGERPAVTLHAYSPPLDRVGAYEVAGDGTLLRTQRAAYVPLRAAAA